MDHKELLNELAFVQTKLGAAKRSLDRLVQKTGFETGTIDFDYIDTISSKTDTSSILVTNYIKRLREKIENERKT